MKIRAVVLATIFLFISACSTPDIESATETNTPEGVTAESPVNEVEQDENYLLYDVGWSDDKSGVITTIDHVVIEEREDTLNGGTYNVLGVHFKLQNQSSEPLTTYPDQGKLVIGETQIESNMVASDRLGGELLNGATKEGYVAFDLPETVNFDSLSEIRLAWSHYTNVIDDTGYDIKLTLTEITP